MYLRLETVPTPTNTTNRMKNTMTKVKLLNPDFCGPPLLALLVVDCGGEEEEGVLEMEVEDMCELSESGGR